jgi:hypothetical protein
MRGRRGRWRDGLPITGGLWVVAALLVIVLLASKL